MIGRNREREIARRLREVPAGEPPADLLGRLRADVPTDLAERLAADRRDDDPAPARPARPLGSLAWVPAAAALVMLVGGGFLVWRVFEGVPLVGMDGEPRAVRTAAPREAEPAVAGTRPPETGDDDQTAVSRDAEIREGAFPEAELDALGRARAEADEDAEVLEETGEAEKAVTLPGAGSPRAAAGEPPTRPAAPADAKAAEARSALTPPPPPADAAASSATAAEAPPPERRETEIRRRAAAALRAAPEPEPSSVPGPPPAATSASPSQRHEVGPRELPSLGYAGSARRSAVHPFVETSADRLSTFGLGADVEPRGDRPPVEPEPPPAAVRAADAVGSVEADDPDLPPGQVFGLLAEGGPSPFRDDPRFRLIRFVVQTGGSLVDVEAAEARAQVEIEERAVVRWRPIGDHGRTVEGAVGPGDSVSALYEVELVQAAPLGEVALFELRWRDPKTGRLHEMTRPVRAADIAASWEAASPGFRLAAITAAFAEAVQSPSIDPERLGELARRAEALAVEAGTESGAAALARRIRREEQVRAESAPP